MCWRVLSAWADHTLSGANYRDTRTYEARMRWGQREEISELDDERFVIRSYDQDEYFEITVIDKYPEEVFGQILDIHVRDREPVFVPEPNVVRDVKLDTLDAAAGTRPGRLRVA